MPDHQGHLEWTLDSAQAAPVALPIPILLARLNTVIQQWDPVLECRGTQWGLTGLDEDSWLHPPTVACKAASQPPQPLWEGFKTTLLPEKPPGAIPAPR